jgi:hypothetical protein
MREWRSLGALNPKNTLIKSTRIIRVLAYFMTSVFVVYKASSLVSSFPEVSRSSSWSDIWYAFLVTLKGITMVAVDPGD